MTNHSGGPIGDNHGAGSGITSAFIAILVLIAVVTFLGLLAGVILVLFPQPWSGPLGALAVAGLLVAGLTACGLMLSAVIVYRQMARLLEQVTTIDQQTAIMAEQSVARTQADTYVRSTMVDPAELRDLLAKIHETLLLPEDERARRFENMVEREVTERLAVTEQFIDSSDFHRARGELAALAERFGADVRIQEARERLEKAADAARADDIARVSRHVEDLMGAARWESAERMALELAEKHPVADEAASLIERVQRERKLFEQNHRQRMHEGIQELVHERRWQEAVTAARQFIQTFPVGPDADALRAQIETLEANADIQARQALERHIKQYIQQQQYWDALALARRIISEYPLSPQANALRAQLPRIEELARKQGPQK